MSSQAFSVFRFEIVNNPCICGLQIRDCIFWQKYQFDEFQWVLKGLWVTWCIIKKKNDLTIFQFQLSIKSAKDVFHYFSIRPWHCIGKVKESSWTRRYSEISKAT